MTRKSHSKYWWGVHIFHRSRAFTDSDWARCRGWDSPLIFPNRKEAKDHADLLNGLARRGHSVTKFTAKPFSLKIEEFDPHPHLLDDTDQGKQPWET
jgi:hypothetical protein